MTAELAYLQDADSLDRVRLGDFDSRYLRLPYLHGEEQRARQLWAASHPWFYPEPWLAVRAACVTPL